MCDRIRFLQAPSSQWLHTLPLLLWHPGLFQPPMAAGCYTWHQSPKLTSVHQHLLESHIICTVFLVHVMVFKDIKPLLWQLLFPHQEEKWEEEEKSKAHSHWQLLAEFNLHHLSWHGDGDQYGPHLLTSSICIPKRRKWGTDPCKVRSSSWLPAFLCTKLILLQCIALRSLAVQGHCNDMNASRGGQ